MGEETLEGQQTSVQDFMSVLGNLDFEGESSPFEGSTEEKNSSTDSKNNQELTELVDSPFDENLEENKVTDDKVDPNNIFGEDNSQEKVGEDKLDNNTSEEGKEDTSTQDNNTNSSTSSPDTSQIYSTTLAIMKEDGVLPDLDDDFIKNVKTSEDFAEAINRQVQARIDETTRRVSEALDNNVDIDEIKYYENAIKYFEGLTDTELEDETEKGEELRRKLILADYSSKGFSKERAERATQISFKNGTDIEDAKEALNSVKESYKQSYQEVLDEAKQAAALKRETYNKQAQAFKKLAIETEEPFEGLKIDAKTRQSIYDNVTKPSIKDEEGRVLSEIQKYTLDNPADAQYYFSLFYTITNGFKDLNKLGKEVSKKNNKENLSKLERALKGANSTSTAISGGETFDFGNSKDPESHFSLGNLTFDISKNN